MGVRRAVAGDEVALRTIRLRALSAAPRAFGATYASSAARTDEEWRRWFSPGATFFFETTDGECVAMVAAVWPDDLARARGEVPEAGVGRGGDGGSEGDDGSDGEGEPPAVARLMAMWVDPEARGLGIADALVRAVLRFAADAEAAAVRVQVHEHNQPAIGLYERNGFVATGHRLGPDELGRMELELSQPVPAALAAEPAPPLPITGTDLLDVVGHLDRAGLDVWVDGGWAVDALLGEQTRTHGDLDLAVAAAHRGTLTETMQDHGFTTVRLDNRHNVVMADPSGRHVDLHLVDLTSTRTDERGVEVYGPDGLAYEVGAFEATGTVDGRPVRCCTPDFLVRAHTGYAIDADDVRDVQALCARFAIALPDQHARFLAEHGEG